MQVLGGAGRGQRGAKGREMSSRYKHVLFGVATSFSLIVAGGGSDGPTPGGRPPTAPPPPAATAIKPAAQSAEGIDTEATLWTVLGLGKRESEQDIGPRTGNAVSPILWQATQDTLHFAGFASEDPMTGLLVTEWYSPPGKPSDRLRVSVFI